MRTLIIASLLLCAAAANADSGDREQLASLLNRFLAGAADDVSVHRRFWAEDLIYTSSSGQRFGKAEILRGFASGGEPVATSYRAEDIDIRLFGDTAVVAFRLVGDDRNSNKPVTSNYFNTGTFVKRDGQWRAVAWQATRIPVDTD